jgi:hypothetical protein
MEPIEVFLTNNDKIIGYPYGKRKLWLIPYTIIFKVNMSKSVFQLRL